MINQIKINRVHFDPSNNQHLESFKIWVRTGNWGNIQFKVEMPYIDVPTTVMMKYIQHSLDITRETNAERTDRFVKSDHIIPWFKAMERNRPLAFPAALNEKP